MPQTAPAPRGEPEPQDARETKDRLLDAAERLFAERGFEGTSLRALTQTAGTSLSAANYHFGSKEALLRATLLRRVGPMNRQRLERLEAAGREAGGVPLSVEAVLDAFLRPLFEERAKRSEVQREARFVAARLYSDPPELVSALKQELFGEASRRFLDALGRALPGRPPAELALRFQFAVGAMVHVMSGNLEDAPHLPELRERSGTHGDPSSDEAVLQQLLAFLAAGFRAPAEDPR